MKRVKLEHKLILAFMLPIPIIMITGIAPYFTGARIHKEIERMRAESLTFIESIQSLARDDPRAAAYIDAHRASVQQRYAAVRNMMKRQHVITLVLVQIGIIPIILIGVLVTRNIRKMKDSGASQEDMAVKNDPELIAEMMGAMFAAYQSRTGGNPLDLIEKIKEKVGKRNDYSNF